jgi:hypothetical protein
MTSIGDLELRIVDLEERLRPIANRPVDITKTGWAVELSQSPHPFDEAGVRSEAETLLEELIGFYRACRDEQREAIRALFAEYRAFAWAASLPFDPTSDDNLRRHLLLFSIKDQGRDSRDALLWLQDLCRKAKRAGVATEPVLRDVAEISSHKNKYGMGSTGEMLLRACSTSQ